MITYEHDPDVVRWGLHLLDVCTMSNFGACNTLTQYEPDLSNVEYVREEYMNNVESDEVIARALQEELSKVAAAEAYGISKGEEKVSILSQDWPGPSDTAAEVYGLSKGEEEHMQASILSQDWHGPSDTSAEIYGPSKCEEVNQQASILSQDWSGPSDRNYNYEHWHDEKVAYDSGVEAGPSRKFEELGIPSLCPSPEETSYIGGDLSHSLDIMDEFALDGEVGKRFDQMVPVPHVPKINGEIPTVDEAVSDHQRLLDRLEIYELVEMKMRGDGNCQFRALSDQLYRSPEHHKFVRELVVNQLKSHPEMYEGHVPMAYADYSKKMSKSGEWGDHVTLQAAADTYGVKMFMITSFKNTCYIEILPRIQKSERVIFLSFWAEVHYNSIYPKGDLPIPDAKQKKKWWMI